jgi:hypothetical protein
MLKSVVNIVTKLCAGIPAVRIPAGRRYFYILHNAEMVLEPTRSAIESMCT